MLKNVLAGLLLVASVIFFNSCSKEDISSTLSDLQLAVYDAENSATADVLSTSDQTETAVLEMRGGPCFTIVFPVTVLLPDSTTQEVASADEFKSLLKSLGRKESRHVHILFPYDVTLSDGTVVTVNSKDDIKAIIEDCRGTHEAQDTPCYTVNFPVTIVFPDNSSTTVASKEELIAAVKAWISNGNRGRPEIAYPYTVTLKDGTIATINSKADIEAIREACRPDKGGHNPNTPCYELQFPLQIKIGKDNITVNSEGELRAATKRGHNVQIQFPYSVKIVETGEIVTINDASQLRQLIKDCRG